MRKSLSLHLANTKNFVRDSNPMREYLQRTVLILNGILFLLGFLAFAVGMTMAFSNPLLRAYAKPVIQGALDNKEMLKPSDYSNSDAVAKIYSSIIQPFGFVTVLFGLFAMGLAAFAVYECIFSSGMKKKIYLGLSLSFLILLIIILVLTGTLKLKIKHYVEQRLKNMMSSFSGEEVTNHESVAWIYTQMKFRCCGVRNGDDYQSLSKWSGGSYQVYREFAVSCCKVDQKYRFNNLDCIKFPSKANSYADTGCLEKVNRKLAQIVKAPALLLSSCIFLNIAASIFIWTLHNYKSDDMANVQDADKLDED